MKKKYLNNFFTKTQKKLCGETINFPDMCHEIHSAVIIHLEIIDQQILFSLATCNYIPFTSKGCFKYPLTTSGFAVDSQIKYTYVELDSRGL